MLSTGGRTRGGHTGGASLDSLAMRDSRKLIVAGIVFLVGGVIAIVLFNQIWLRIGLGTTFALIIIGCLILAWHTDKKDRAEREGLEQI
jgi:uncharacterized membrane protein YhhN